MDERRGTRNERLKLEEKEDRISDLPDPLLQHILSFLPSTKEAVKTGILSQRWRNQWTRVPVLIFKSPSETFGEFDEQFIRFIDTTLLHHNCSKIQKLHLAYDFDLDPNFSGKIQFAKEKHVEELILDYSNDEDYHYRLPEFLFDNASLVELNMSYCSYYFMGDFSVNLGSLKACRIERSGYRDFVANVLFGSPLLESLELKDTGDTNYVIASKSLKILILVQVNVEDDACIQISCPNLEELCVKGGLDYCGRFTCLPNKTIEKYCF